MQNPPTFRFLPSLLRGERSTGPQLSPRLGTHRRGPQLSWGLRARTLLGKKLRPLHHGIFLQKVTGHELHAEYQQDQSSSEEQSRNPALRELTIKGYKGNNNKDSHVLHFLLLPLR